MWRALLARLGARCSDLWLESLAVGRGSSAAKLQANQDARREPFLSTVKRRLPW
jgi:hypothetical protein